MNGGIDFITLISLVVAVVAILMLRSVLGRRTGDEESRIERYRSQARQQESARTSDKVVTLPRRDQDDTAGQRTQEVSSAEAEERIADFAKSNQSLQGGLMQILGRDPAFDPENFLNGAKQAYEMIVTAFAEGNRRLLKELLSKDVYEGFVQAISEREARGEQIDQSFVGIDKAEVLSADVSKDGIASVTVKFISQLISATRNTSGEVIEGDEHQIKDVTDIWTFSRDVSNQRAVLNPNWRLVATQIAA